VFKGGNRIKKSDVDEETNDEVICKGLGFL